MKRLHVRTLEEWRGGLSEHHASERPLADGRRQEPGGWNRTHLQVTDLEDEVERLRAAAVPFRTNEIVTGSGGAQVIIEDPSGNPIELFQARRSFDLGQCAS